MAHAEQPEADRLDIEGVSGQEIPARKIGIPHLRIVLQRGRRIFLGLGRDRVKEEILAHAIFEFPVGLFQGLSHQRTRAVTFRVHEIDHDLLTSDQIVIEPDLFVVLRPEYGVCVPRSSRR